MNNLFRINAPYSAIVGIALLVLAVTAAAISANLQPSTKQPIETLQSQPASGLKVQGANAGQAQATPVVPSSGSGSASSSGVTTLQPSSPNVSSGSSNTVSYPCTGCDQASDSTDITVCAYYCVSPDPIVPTPTPTPTPLPSPYPGCSCRGNIREFEPSTTICPMMACPITD